MPVPAGAGTAFSDKSRGVWHTAYQLDIRRQQSFNICNGLARCNADDQSLLPEDSSDLRKHLPEKLRLDGQEKDIRFFCYKLII